MITEIPETFCPQPFNYVYPNHNGSWKPCCKCTKFPIKKMSFDEWWHEDEDLRNLRRSLITGENSKIYEKTCKPCYGPEKRNSTSYRQYILKNITNNNSNKNFWLRIIDIASPLLGAINHEFPFRPLPLIWLSVIMIIPFVASPDSMRSHASTFVDSSLW